MSAEKQTAWAELKLQDTAKGPRRTFKGWFKAAEVLANLQFLGTYEFNDVLR